MLLLALADLALLFEGFALVGQTPNDGFAVNVPHLAVMQCVGAGKQVSPACRAGEPYGRRPPFLPPHNRRIRHG